MIYKKYTIEIPNYITHIELSKARRPKYYNVTEEDKIPKKHKKLGITYDKKGIALDSNGEKIVKNTRVAGTPKLWKINSQDLYSGNLHHHSRAKIMVELHKYFVDVITKNLLKSLKDNKIELEEGQKLAFYYTFEGSLSKNKSDLGNKAYLYDKAFQDTITQRDLSNTKQQNVHKIPIIQDDSLGYVYNINFNFIEKEEEKLIINIYICDKEFNITDLIDKTFKL